MTTTRVDPGLPWLAAALDAETAGPRILRALSEHRRVPAAARLVSVTLRRHKLGRRALIRYHAADPASGWHQTALGKTRSRGLDIRTAALLDALAATRLGLRGAGVAAVPRTLGAVPEYRLWLQEEVAGRPGFAALASRDGAAAASRIGIALAELHQVGPPSDRQHTLVDELTALDCRYRALAASDPRLALRLRRLFDRLTRLAESVEAAAPVGLHRDFYPDQLLLGDRVQLLDLDLYAHGDPALDLGNFIAHLIEFDLRTGRRAPPLASLASRFLEGYRSVREGPTDRSIHRYETLTLARQVALSVTLARREHTTELLLRECERRVEEA